MHPTRFSLRRASLLGLMSLSLATAPLHASLLVYEGFNGYSAGSLAGQTPNGNTVGLNTTTGYYDGAATSRAANYTLAANSLSFGSLTTTGGALSFTTGTNVIGAKIDIGATGYTGTLWSSYLVNLSFISTGSGDGALMRIGKTNPSDSTNAHFNSWADSRNDTSNTIGTSYTNTGVDGSGSLATNTTYILISKFTRVGQSVDGTNTGVATQWALDASQFAAFLAAGGDEAALGSVTITGMSTDTFTTTSYNTFSSSDALALVTVDDVGTFDELRFGTELADVTPSSVPEPAAAVLLSGLACAAWCAVRRRRYA